MHRPESTSAVEFVAPVSGDIIELERVPDPVFAAGILGQGFAVIPLDDTVVAPVAGTVSAIPDSLHAIYITAIDGTVVLVHVGLDTVELAGAHLSPLVAVGDEVSVGQPILRADFAAIASAGFHTHTMVCVVEGPAAGAVAVTKTGAVTSGEPVAHALQETS